MDGLVGELLRERVYFGIGAPALAWLASGLIVTATLLQLLWLARAVLWRLAQARRGLKAVLQPARDSGPLRGRGVREQTFEVLKRVLSVPTLLGGPWAPFESECVRTLPAIGAPKYGYGRTRPASDSFSEDALVD